MVEVVNACTIPSFTRLSAIDGPPFGFPATIDGVAGM
jgi:hypothetical protein